MAPYIQWTRQEIIKQFYTILKNGAPEKKTRNGRETLGSETTGYARIDKTTAVVK